MLLLPHVHSHTLLLLHMHSRACLQSCINIGMSWLHNDLVQGLAALLVAL